MTLTTQSKKSAMLKLAILQAVKDLIEKRSYKDLHIKEVCERVNVSKVTLFKYFSQKEDILQYYIRIWTFHRAVELHQNPKKGVNGIFYIVEKLADSFASHPGLMLGFIGQMVYNNTFPKPFPVKVEEKKLLYPNIEDIEKVKFHSIEQLIEAYLLDAIFHSEITKSSDTQYLTNLLMSTIYGTITSAHRYRIEAPKLYFRRNIEIVLKGLR